MMRAILNDTDPETKMFHGHRATAWMHWKDVITSIIRQIKNRHAHKSFKDLDLMWKFLLLLKPIGEEATEEVLVYRKDCASMDWVGSLEPSKHGCIDDERALWSTPMLIRSIHKYQDCVEWTKQNVAVYPKF